MARQTLEVECWFLIPIVRDSDRGVHQPVLWRLLEEALSDAWGGWTGPETMRWGRKKGIVPGGWKPKTSVRAITDESRKYTVFAPPAKLDDLRALLKKAANSFDQQELLSVRDDANGSFQSRATASWDGLRGPRVLNE